MLLSILFFINREGYTRVVEVTVACTRVQALLCMRVPRVDLFDVDAHPKNNLNNKNEVLIS